MAFEYEGDVTLISEPQLEYIARAIEELGFKNGKVVFSAVGKAGDNFVANVKRITVEKNGETLKMIAKIAPNNEFMRGQMNTTMMFGNETYMYQLVLPKLTEFEKKIGIPENERFKYAACYGAHTEVPNEVILLQDLQPQNFTMLDKFISLSDDSIKLVLKNFAMLHSFSHVLKKQEPETFEEFKSNLPNAWTKMQGLEDIQKFFSQLEDDVLSILDEDEHKNLVKGSLTQLPDLSVKNLEIDRNSKYGVIQQGDSWTNNILFKLEGDKAVECCMIDYQISNVNSPVADIQYLIFNCTDYETRHKNYDDWIKYYHEQHDQRLTRFGLQADSAYPREQLDADLRRLGRISFGLSIMLASMLMREHHEAAKFKELMQNSQDSMSEIMSISKLSNMEKSSFDRFKNRIDGIIKSFTELGYL